LEKQEQLAEKLCPRFDDWIRGRNRIQSTPARSARRPRLVGIVRPREREHQPRATRRTASSSSTSSSDPGDPEHEPPRRSGELRHISHALAAFLEQLGGAR